VQGHIGLDLHGRLLGDHLLHHGGERPRLLVGQGYEPVLPSDFFECVEEEAASLLGVLRPGGAFEAAFPGADFGGGWVGLIDRGGVVRVFSHSCSSPP